jgi:hypothetical protein
VAACVAAPEKSIYEVTERLPLWGRRKGGARLLGPYTRQAPLGSDRFVAKTRAPNPPPYCWGQAEIKPTHTHTLAR